MHRLKRVGYYLIGVAFGSIIVLFIWKGKDVSFDYGMDARTLKSIRKKQLVYSATAQTVLSKSQIDTIAVNAILHTGDVNFDKSEQRKKPCAEYFITGTYEEKNIDLYVQRCDSIATIQTIWVKN